MNERRQTYLCAVCLHLEAWNSRDEVKGLLGELNEIIHVRHLESTLCTVNMKTIFSLSYTFGYTMESASLKIILWELCTFHGKYMT